MKKILVLIMFLLLFPAVSFSQPSIAFDAESHDFGTIQQGEKIEHTFTLKNNGNEDLEIQRLSAS
jgi:hypothetical protein